MVNVHVSKDTMMIFRINLVFNVIFHVIYVKVEIVYLIVQHVVEIYILDR